MRGARRDRSRWRIGTLKHEHHAPQQVKAARRLLEWSQPTLATRARISRKTVLTFEKGRRQTTRCCSLEGAGVEFSPWCANLRKERASP